MNWSEPKKINTSFIARDLGDEIVLMSEDGQEIHSFEDTGLRVWQGISENQSPDQILQAMLDEYEVDEKVLRADLELFFQELIEKGIIE